MEDLSLGVPPQEKIDFNFWKNLVLVIVFVLATPLTIAISAFALTLSDTPEPKVLAITKTENTPGVQLFASLPANIPTISGAVELADSRPEKISRYLQFYGSSLAPHARTLVDAADFYNIDYKLMTAIAQQESNLCKWIPPNSYNCWGWGIHSKGTLKFGSFEEAIWTVAQGLKYEYIDKGYITPEEIMSKYTPLSNGSWARGVSEFMSEIE